MARKFDSRFGADDVNVPTNKIDRPKPFPGPRKVIPPRITPGESGKVRGNPKHTPGHRR